MPIGGQTCWRSLGTTIHHPIPRRRVAIPVELVGMDRMVRCMATPMGCTALDRLRLRSLGRQRSLAKRSLAGLVGHSEVHHHPFQLHRSSSVLELLGYS